MVLVWTCGACFFFFFTGTAPTEIYPLSLHDALPILAVGATVLAGIFQLYVPQYLGRAVDQARGLLDGGVTATGRAAAEEALMATALLLIGASLLRGLFTMMQNYQGEAVGQLIGYDMQIGRASCRERV